MKTAKLIQSELSRRYHSANSLSSGMSFKCLITVLILLTFFIVWADNQPVDAESPDALFIDQKGNVGIGTNQPTAKLDVKGTLNASQFTRNGLDMLVPIGTIMAYGGDVNNEEIKKKLESQGWLACDGHQIRRNEYPELFKAIGVAFGEPDPNTFNLPDLRGRVAVGAGSAENLTPRTLGENGGEEEHTLDVNEIPPHNHPFEEEGVDYGSNTWRGGGKAAGAWDVVKKIHKRNTNDSGSGKPHNNLQPYLTVNFIIKY